MAEHRHLVPAPENDPDLLELRIHGVRNTPPHEMLLTDPGRTVSCRGDALAGFSTYAEPRPADAPAGRHVEAYGWGLLARFTGIPTLGRVGDSIVRVFWFSMAPYGLANAAYWARLRFGRGGDLAHDMSRGLGAGTLRLFGLLLTLLYITTASTVAFDMAGAQCFDGPESGLRGCGPISAALAPVSEWAPGSRNAALLGIPLLALLLVLVLPVVARTRYLPGVPVEPHGDRPSRNGTSVRGTGADSRSMGGGPVAGLDPGPAIGTEAADHTLLGRRDLWVVGSGMGRLRRVHAGASLGWMATLLAVARLDGAAGSGGPDALSAVWWWTLAALAGVGVAVVGGAFMFRSQAEVPGAEERRPHNIYLVTGITVLTLAFALSLLDGTTPIGHRPGALAAVAVVLGLAAVLGVVAVQCWIAVRGAPWPGGGDQAAAQAGNPRMFLGWRGYGPFVFNALAAGFGLLLSFAAVVAAGWALGGLETPTVFTLVGAGFLLLALGAAAALGICQLRVRLAGRGLIEQEIAAAREALVAETGEWAEPQVVDAAARKAWRSRRTTALLRRGEVFAGWFAWAVAAGVWAGWAMALLWVAGWVAPEHGIWEFARLAGAVGLGTGVLLVGVLALASSRSEARPFSLLWDLICFLPTQGHPFGPPCYSERVVPELADRMVDWLDGVPGHCAGGGDPGRRRVVVSAHSIGLVLAVCTLFQLRAHGVPSDQLSRIGIVGYGVQLRRYFCRFFPGLMGPDVMSLVPAGPPSAVARDPWPPLLLDEIASEREAGREMGGWPQAVAGPLHDLLGDRWVNLYRPNDPLGFPARYRAPAAQDPRLNDRRAAEYRRGAYQFQVATHGNYLESRAYAEGFTCAAHRLMSGG